MKVIITESKLNDAITKYLDGMFDVDDINWTYPEEYDDEGSHYEDETRIQFYIGDYDGEDEACFRWYDCEYFNPGSHARDICPTVVVEHPYVRTLNGYFGDLWYEPFKNWFTKNFKLPVKTVEYM